MPFNDGSDPHADHVRSAKYLDVNNSDRVRQCILRVFPLRLQNLLTRKGERGEDVVGSDMDVRKEKNESPLRWQNTVRCGSRE